MVALCHDAAWCDVVVVASFIPCRWMEGMGADLLDHLRAEDRYTSAVFRAQGLYRTKQDLLAELTASFGPPQVSCKPRCLLNASFTTHS